MAALLMAPPAYAIGTSVDLGTSASYSVLAGQAVTNTGPTVLTSNVGVSPGTAIAGFPPGVIGGAAHAADAHVLQAQAALTTAYNEAAGQASDAAVGADLGGLTLAPGVYTAASSTKITGPLRLDAKGDPKAVFIFQIGSALTTATSSSVVLLNNAQSCNVFWQVGSSATLETGTTFAGTIMALTSITARTGATIEGRALARNGSVSLDTTVFTDSRCATRSTTPTATASAGPAGTATGAPTAMPTARTSVSPRRLAAPSPIRSSSTAIAGEESSESDSTRALAYTGGGPSGPVIGIALGAIVGGAVLVLFARRRRTI